MADQVSSKNGIVYLLLAFFLGFLGIHRFYTGKVGTGLLTLITVGFGGIWPLIDIILLLMGKATDSDGNKIKLSN